MARHLILDAWVPGSPKPKGSLQTFVPHYGDNHADPALRGQPVRRDDGGIVVNVVEDNAKTKRWMRDVAATALDGMRLDPSEGIALDIEIATFLRRPEGHYGTGSNARFVKPIAPAYPIAERSGDVDKLARAILDALSGVVMKTDATVRRLEVTKDYAVPTEDGDGLGARIRVFAAEAQIAQELPLEQRVRALSTRDDEPAEAEGQLALGAA